MKNSNIQFLGKWPVCIIALTISFACLSCSEDSEPEIEEVPEKEFVEQTFTGRYIGGWWSNASNGSVYKNYPASAIIKETEDENKWVGEFFYTRTHTSCCSSNPNDGTISFTLKDGIISDFKYAGTIPDCSSDFRGEGKVEDSGKIIINLTAGRDCEGDHTNARIELSK
ncbi:hypothetical protein [Ekhidna sp.]